MCFVCHLPGHLCTSDLIVLFGCPCLSPNLVLSVTWPDCPLCDLVESVSWPGLRESPGKARWPDLIDSVTWPNRVRHLSTYTIESVTWIDRVCHLLWYCLPPDLIFVTCHQTCLSMSPGLRGHLTWLTCVTWLLSDLIEFVTFPGCSECRCICPDPPALSTWGYYNIKTIFLIYTAATQ